MSGARSDHWIQTYSGGRFWPMDPRTDEIKIEDIAHALSLQCRFAGHVKRFYSVAEHSIRASLIVREEHALGALLHDASEAYLVDVPRPIKPLLVGYRETEDSLMRIIAEKFGFVWPLCREVETADLVMLATEARDLLIGGPKDWPLDISGLMLSDTIEPMLPAVAEVQFLARFKELTR